MKNAKKIFIKTYGCQMNVFDTERILESLVHEGYDPVESSDDADLILLNTCHIREKAAEKVYSELGRYKKLKLNNPNLKVGVVGCVAQAEGAELMARQPLVDLVVGPQVYHRLPDLLKKISTGERVVDTDFPVEDKFKILARDTEKKRAPSAFLTVQEGCDKFCAFCVVPYTRGAEVSRSVEQLVLEARSLSEKGVIELTLLGQNVNAYRGLGPDGKYWTLASLMSKILEIKELKRIRFTTSHPRDMSNDLIEMFGNEEKLMPFLHLPVQSGSNKILKAMNRGHTSETYTKLIGRIRGVRPDIAISGDFIVGFPGETEADFQETMKICDKVKYSQAFSFKYSARPGTPAADKSEVNELEKSDRLARLQDTLRKSQQDFQKKMIGSIQPILIEKIGKKEGQVIGKSPYLQPVFLNASISSIGKILPVKIEESRTNGLSGSEVEISL